MAIKGRYNIDMEKSTLENLDLIFFLTNEYHMSLSFITQITLKVKLTISEADLGLLPHPRWSVL